MKVAVVGCGVGGMASAIALARKRHTVTLFEAFATPRPLGSGLLLQPSGLAALRHLSLDQAVCAMGARVERLEGRDDCGRRVLDLDYSRWRSGTHGLGISRHAMFNVLYDAARQCGIEVITGTAIGRIADFTKPRLRAGDGREFGGYDLAVIADGSGSCLRPQLNPRARAPIYPWGALWANCSDPDGVFAGALSQRYAGTEVMIGVLPIGVGQVSFFWSLPVADQHACLEGGFTAWVRQVNRYWPEAAFLLNGLIPSDFSRAIYRDVRAGAWNRGACVMIGDAAHGTSPQLGQGANLALLDAVELAESLDGPVIHALGLYQARRRRQTALYQFMSRLLTPLFQSSGRKWLWVRRWLFTPLVRAPLARWFVAGGLTGTARLGPTPVCSRLHGRLT